MTVKVKFQFQTQRRLLRNITNKKFIAAECDHFGPNESDNNKRMITLTEEAFRLLKSE